jgi:hypothetical protein
MSLLANFAKNQVNLKVAPIIAKMMAEVNGWS